jgi:hypothetical protein
VRLWANSVVTGVDWVVAVSMDHEAHLIDG